MCGVGCNLLFINVYAATLPHPIGRVIAIFLLYLFARDTIFMTKLVKFYEIKPQMAIFFD